MLVTQAGTLTIVHDSGLIPSAAMAYDEPLPFVPPPPPAFADSVEHECPHQHLPTDPQPHSCGCWTEPASNVVALPARRALKAAA